MKAIKISTSAYKQIMKDVKAGKKIAAIKELRRDSSSSLRDAKDAIERLMYEHDGSGHKTHEVHAKSPRILVGPIIKKMTLNFGNGDIEVDLDTMQMIALMEMQKIGLDACGDILDLVETLKAYSDGKTIGVVSEESD